MMRNLTGSTDPPVPWPYLAVVTEKGILNWPRGVLRTDIDEPWVYDRRG
ncbi:MAG: hypothetical protein QGG23_03815 [Candidatus Bathyarchaeota archaeon]|nr:hypothetical protein [Candidatus Bathyarchaeota archaeon]MDP7207301.1 hypothetical protein [Candidatus Bathyarchaeota archaeon]MDP7443001.1 hypothetical protein [Candidatus Bathyarchaeota archaeon]